MKKSIVWFLTIVLMLSLTACGSAGTGGEVGNDVPGNVGNQAGTNKNDNQAGEADKESAAGASEQEQTEAPTETQPAKGADLSDVLLSITSEYYLKGELSDKDTRNFEYDAQGNPVVDIDIIHETQGRVTYLTDTQCEYDESGRLIRSLDRKYIEKFYSYDESGRLVRVEYEGQLHEKCHIAYTYDADGNLISVWEGEENGIYWDNGVEKQGKVCHQEFLYTYTDGKLTHMEHNENGFTETEDYTYDAAGRLEMTTCTDRYGFVTWINYTYDEAGNMIKAEYTTELRGEIRVERTDEFTYDAQGRVLTFTLTAGSYTKYLITYEYGAY